jgi:hypothetical protein
LTVRYYHKDIHDDDVNNKDEDFDFSPSYFILYYYGYE